jgi:hypothetical protein
MVCDVCNYVTFTWFVMYGITCGCFMYMLTDTNLVKYRPCSPEKKKKKKVIYNQHISKLPELLYYNLITIYVNHYNFIKQA